MLKRIVSLFVIAAGLAGVCAAQVEGQGSLDAIRQNPLKAAGSFYVYDYADIPALTPAPEGYQPFYISHFGRHGARYCTSEYESVHDMFSKAADAGVLTEAGKDFRARFEAFYREVKLCRGNLTGVGKAQHRAIAEHMYQRFPEVFEGPTHVEAVSTESGRVIMSMWSCLSRLQSLDQDMDVRADASARYCTWLQPSLSSNPYLVKGWFDKGEATEKAYDAYFEQTVPWKTIAGKFFTGDDVLKDVLKASPRKFIDAMYSVAVGSRCLDEGQGAFDDLFSADELVQVWKAASARFFLHMGRFEGSECLMVDYAAFTLEQIIQSADADMASGDTQLRLRFGHDSGIGPLLVLLDADGCGRSTSSFDECLDIYPSYRVPMGASLQLVFYKNAAEDVLVKLLVNEQEATLPLPAVQGVYYRWADFKAHYLPMIPVAKRKIVTAEPMAALKAVDWNWQPVQGSKVEVGYASVKVFGSTQSISIARFPSWAHTVSVVESDGPKAAVTSTFGTRNKALAAINGSYFDRDVMPVTFVKDEGRVLCDRTTDGGTRSNGMFRIRDKKGRKVDILTVGEDGPGKAAQGWREAIVSGPVLLEEGEPVSYDHVGAREFRRFYGHRHPRTLLGYTSDGWLYFIVVDGRFPGQADGMSIAELQVLCESLGLYEAINLDGGGSSTLWSSDAGVVNHPYDNQVFDHAGERVVPNVIIVK